MGKKLDRGISRARSGWFSEAAAAPSSRRRFPTSASGCTGVSLAFGLTVLTMVYTIGPVSGCHINPAVSIGLWAGGRFPASSLIPYVVAQVVGGDRRRRRALRHRERQGRASTSRAASPRTATRAHSPGGYSLDRVPRHRGRDDVHVPDRHPRRHRQAGAGGLRRNRHRPRAHADPSRQHSGDEHVREPGPQHRPRRSSSAAGPSSSSGSSGSLRSSARCSPGRCIGRPLKSVET